MLSNLLFIEFYNLTLGDIVAALVAIASLAFFFWRTFKNNIVTRTIGESNAKISADRTAKLDAKVTDFEVKFNCSLLNQQTLFTKEIEKLQNNKVELELYMESQRRYDEQMLRLREDLNNSIDRSAKSHDKLVERLDAIYNLMAKGGAL